MSENVIVPTAGGGDLSRRVAEEIRAMMARRRISGRELARKLGVSQSWVSYRLTGIQPIDLNDLQRIAEALDVTVLDLLPRDLRTVVTVTSPNLAPYQPNRGRPPGHPPGPSRPTGARRPQRSRPQLVPGYGLAG
jgi:transcriptional regulator with XRE-family HTH domain